MAVVKLQIDDRIYEGTLTEVTVPVSVPPPAPEPGGNVIIFDNFDAGNLDKWTDSQVSDGARLAVTSNALRAFARPGDKAEAGKVIEAVGVGGILDFTGKYKISRGAELNELYLADLELNRAGGGGESEPGPRLCIKHGTVCVERGKIDDSTLRSNWSFPIDKWTTLRWRMQLGVADRGVIQVWADGQKIIDTTGTNIPPPGKINRLRVGITINSSSKDCTLAVDDVQLSKE